MGNGRLGIVDGTYAGLGRDLKIEKGAVNYASSPLDNPGLDVRAVAVTGEVSAGLTLTGTARVPLIHPNVVLGSVVVTNQAKTQTFIENVDYLVIVVGAETSLQRLASGSILDGENVLVDYTYDIGGTFAYTQLDQTFNLNWNVSRNIDAYFRWFDSSPEITSGVSTFPLNASRSAL